MSPASRFSPAAFWIGSLFTGSFVYALVRYHLFKGVDWAHLPLYTSNKAVALSAVLLIGLSYGFSTLRRLAPYKFRHVQVQCKPLGLAGFGLGTLHVLISLLLLRPPYYPTLFDGEQFNLTGELSLLFGVLCLFCFALPAASSLPSLQEALGPARWIRLQRCGYAGLLLVAGHVLVMGIEGWLAPATWPGHLLPVSLVAFLAALVVLLARMLALLQPRRSVRLAD